LRCDIFDKCIVMADEVGTIYCLKCKTQTTPVETHEEVIITRGKQRKQLCGKCSVCDRNVRKFMAGACITAESRDVSQKDAADAEVATTKSRALKELPIDPPSSNIKRTVYVIEEHEDIIVATPPKPAPKARKPRAKKVIIPNKEPSVEDTA